MTLNHVVGESLEEMFEQAAQDFHTLFDGVMAKKQYFDVALSGGATAKAFFGFLINQIMSHKHLARLRFFFSDERVVDLESYDSNAGNAFRLLIEPLAINNDQFFPMYDGKNRPEA
jgi:6-phosphogluconolactonase/glucosamine-6-phosphate isomerase/deaminase